MAFDYVSFGLNTSDVVGFTSEQRTAIELQATISIVSEAKLESKNLRYPRFKNFYGYAQIMSGAYVVQDIPLTYLNQELLFWRENTLDQNDANACAFKQLFASLTPPVVATYDIEKIRQHFTSIRFRLLPLVQANVGLRWQTLVSRCGNTITDPDPKQGEPVAPNNGNANPGSRPPGQGGDSADRSNNDGGDLPNDDRPPEPTAGGGNVTAVWHWTVKACFVTCAGEVYTVALANFTNPNDKPSFVPTSQNTACPNAQDGNLVAPSGATQGTTSVVESISFDYY